MLSRLFLMLLVASLLLVSGCRTSPVYNVNDAPVSTLASGQPTMEQMRQSITRAGASLGWAMQERSPGLIEGQLHLRDHVAVVEIPYTTTSYSIRYKDSQNLKYDGENIHKNYNGWVQRLDQHIRAQISQY